MNARQKAKKYKRELDILKGRVAKPVFVSSEQVETRTLRIKRIYDSEQHGVALPADVMQNELLRMLGNSEQLREAVKFDYGYFDWSTGCRVCTAELEVVVRR